MPAPPDVALAVGEVAVSGADVGVHAPPIAGVVVPGAVTPGVVTAGVVAAAFPAPGAVPPAVLALALAAPASVNAARLGSIRWATRTVSFVGLRG